MLTKNQADIWADFLSYVEEKCSATEFQNWIAPITVGPSIHEELVLVVPNIFVQEYLIQNYKKELSKFIPVKTNGQLAIEFTIAEKTTSLSLPPPIESCPQNTLKLNPHYTFANFIEGPSNQFAKSAALGVAAHPGKSYNPLFIYGGVGLGKTHLLHGIGHYVRHHHKKIKVQCITTEGFINDIVDNLKHKSIDKMKKYYRSLDLLLVDDIQFLQNRLNFEDEFCNTFETLINENKQIVITSDKPPSQLKLSERLTARMEWGLVTQVVIPDIETRVAILQHKAEIKGIRLPTKIAFFIAQHIFNNVRQLEGAVNRLFAYSRILGTEMTEEVVINTLGELLERAPQKQISIENILKCVGTLFEVRVTDLKGSSRTKQTALPRQVAMYLAKELLSDSSKKLSPAFGGKTHSTLHHAWKKIKHQIESDETLRKQVETVRHNLKN